jgi:hypothetical protein
MSRIVIVALHLHVEKSLLLGQRKAKAAENYKEEKEPRKMITSKGSFTDG